MPAQRERVSICTSCKVACKCPEAWVSRGVQYVPNEIHVLRPPEYKYYVLTARFVESTNVLLKGGEISNLHMGLHTFGLSRWKTQSWPSDGSERGMRL